MLIGPLAGRSGCAGLWAAIAQAAFAVLRAFPIAYVLLFAFFVITHGKAYYLTSIYPVLLAIGAIAIERWMANAYARGATLAAIAVSGAVIAPLAIPLMSEEAYIRYSAALGMTPSATATEHLKQARLPQGFADMHGWPEMAAKIAKVYWSLPPQDAPRRCSPAAITGRPPPSTFTARG